MLISMMTKEKEIQVYVDANDLIEKYFKEHHEELIGKVDYTNGETIVNTIEDTIMRARNSDEFIDKVVRKVNQLMISEVFIMGKFRAIFTKFVLDLLISRQYDKKEE